MSISSLITWLIIGALAGTITGRIIAFKKGGLGWWTNLGIGLVGAIVGGGIFKLFHIDLGLGEIQISAEDLIAAICGSFLFIIIFWIVQKFRSKKKKT